MLMSNNKNIKNQSGSFFDGREFYSEKINGSKWAQVNYGL